MNVSVNTGRYMFLGFGLFAALIMVIGGAHSRDVGHSISGLGFAIFGILSFLNPAPLLRPFGKGYFQIDKLDRSHVILSGIGGVLMIVGAAIHWLS